jgi:hypothetical protein
MTVVQRDRVDVAEYHETFSNPAKPRADLVYAQPSNKVIT